MPKDIKIDLNIEDGQTTFNTKEVVGFLDGVIINSQNKVEIIIESSLGYVILHRHKFQGIEYLSVRNRTTTPEEKLTDIPTFGSFYVHEPLDITIIGAKNSSVSIILRMV